FSADGRVLLAVAGGAAVAGWPGSDTPQRRGLDGHTGGGAGGAPRPPAPRPPSPPPRRGGGGGGGGAPPARAGPAPPPPAGGGGVQPGRVRAGDRGPRRRNPGVGCRVRGPARPDRFGRSARPGLALAVRAGG